MRHFPRQVHQAVAAPRRHVRRITRHYFLRGSALRCHAVNTERATIEGRRGYSVADDYRIRRAVVPRAVESLMTLTSRSSCSHVAKTKLRNGERYNYLRCFSY